ncbi:hypothetical protein VPHD480_0376 [Vibrio phage D480]|nr:hypothetical protein MYOV011v1_p0250 [Vibrio phage 6E35.1a]
MSRPALKIIESEPAKLVLHGSDKSKYVVENESSIPNWRYGLMV